MKGKKRINNFKKERLRERFMDAFDIPKEVVMDLPVISLTGNREISVENFSGLIEYTRQKIRLNTKSGILVIEGIELEAKNMTAERICVKGNILHISFIV